jgi:hypothetical protein
MEELYTHVEKRVYGQKKTVWERLRFPSGQAALSFRQGDRPCR